MRKTEIFYPRERNGQLGAANYIICSEPTIIRLTTLGRMRLAAHVTHWKEGKYIQ